MFAFPEPSRPSTNIAPQDAAPDDKCIAKAKTKYNITLDKAAIEKAMKGTAPFIMNGTRAEIPLPAGYVWPPTKRGPDGL